MVSTQVIDPDGVCSVTQVTVSCPDGVGTYEQVTESPCEVTYELDDGTQIDGVGTTEVYEVLCPDELTPVTQVIGAPPEVQTVDSVNFETPPDGVVMLS